MFIELSINSLLISELYFDDVVVHSRYQFKLQFQEIHVIQLVVKSSLQMKLPPLLDLYVVYNKLLIESRLNQ